MAKSSSKIIMAGLAGLAAGIAVGILIAPDKGSKTRKRLKKKIRQFEEAARQGDLSGAFDKMRSIFKKENQENSGDGSQDENQDPST